MISNRRDNADHGLELRQILTDAQIVGDASLKVGAACNRWNEIEAGDLFVAVNQQDGDGHGEAYGAIERGAVGVVCERLLPISVPQFIVDDSRIAYGQICHALAGCPSERLATIGITGSAGKTVTAHLVDGILKAEGQSTGLLSSLESRLGDTTSSLNSRSAAALAFELSQMSIGHCTHAIVERSSIDLAQRNFAGVGLDAAVITNAHPVNLDFHSTSDNYRNALSLILDSVKSTGFAVVNADDRHSQKFLDMINVPTLTFGIHQQAEISAKILEQNPSFQTFLLTVGGETVPVKTAIIGKQQIYNCLAATAVGLALGIDLCTIVRGIEATKIPGRLERVDYGQQFGLWIDSCLKPNQLNSAIAAVNQVCEGKLWCVCSTDPSQSPEDRYQLGAILERKCEHRIITATQPSRGNDYEASHQVLDGFESPGAARIMPNRANALRWVLSRAEPNDAVLICGAADRELTDNKHEQLIDDREICASCLTHKPIDLGNEGNDIYRIRDYQ